MQSKFPRACRALLALALASGVAAGCTATTTRTVYRPAPKHSSSASSADLVSQAASDECAQFTSVYNEIQAGTQNAHTVGALIVIMNSHGGAWARSLSRAAKIASRPGVPVGHNQARILAVDLDRITLDLDKIRLDISIGQFGKISHTWNQVISDLSTTQTQCSQ